MRLITFKELGPKKGINYSRDHLRRKCRAGEFPQPVPVSSRRIAWLESEVDRHIEELVARRNRGTA